MTTITALQAEEMTLDLRLGDKGLAYTIYKAEGDVYRSSEVLTYNLGLSIEKAVAELFYEQPLLSLPYKQTKVYYLPRAVTLVPEALYTKEESEVWLGSMAIEEESGRLLPYYLGEEGKILLGMMPEGLISLLQRQYLTVTFVPCYVEYLERLIEHCRSEGTERLVVIDAYEALTIAHLGANGLGFLNSYKYVKPWQEESREGEIIYYQSLVWQTLGLSKERCSIEVYTDNITQ